MLILYIITANLWATYATEMQIKTFKNINKFHILLNYLFNVIFCPIAIFIAIIRSLNNTL